MGYANLLPGVAVPGVPTLRNNFILPWTYTQTKDLFGDRAGNRAANLRGRLGTGQVFVPERGVTCDQVSRVCFDGGVADFSQTRRYFGTDAADAID